MTEVPENAAGRWASEGGADPKGPATDVPADDNNEEK